MNIKQLFDDDSAVSPVIGVILMVAITVILAAVIATFVLGLGDQISQTTPQASFSADYDGGSSLTIAHTSGDKIQAGQLYLRGADGGDGSWATKASVTDTFMVSAGNSVDLTVTSSDTVRIIYESPDGGSTATLKTWEGPDA